MQVFYLVSFTDALFDVYFVTTVPRFRKFFTQFLAENVIIKKSGMHTTTKNVINYNFTFYTIIKTIQVTLIYYNNRIFKLFSAIRI